MRCRRQMNYSHYKLLMGSAIFWYCRHNLAAILDCYASKHTFVLRNRGGATELACG